MVQRFMVEKSGAEKFGLKGPGLMLGVEKSGVEMSFNRLYTPIKILKSGSLFNLLDEFAVLNGVKYILSLELDFQFSSISAYIRLRYSQIQYGILE